MLLAAILFAGILTLWVPARWALSALQVALFALAAAKIVRRRSLGAHPVGFMLAAAIAWGLVQAAAGWTVDRATTLDSVLGWLTNIAAFSLALDLYQDAEQREQFLRATLAFTTILGVVSIFTVLTSPAGKVFWSFDAGTDVPTLGPFVYRNQYAAFIEAVLPLAIVGAIRDRRRWVLNTAVAATLFGSVVAGGSRAGSLLCLAEIVVIPLIAYFRGIVNGRMLLRATAGSLGAVAILIGVVGWEPIWNRLQEPNSYSLRLDLVRSSLQMIRDRPLTGFGLGTWPEVYPGYARYDDGSFVNQAHNDWAQWAVEGGVPFFAAMLAIAGWSIRPALQSLWGVGMLGVFVHALVDYPFQQRPALAAFFFAMLGALAASASNHAPAAARERTTARSYPGQ